MSKKKPSLNPWPQRLTDLRMFYTTAGRPMSQEEAAARLCCSVGAFRNWEQGRRKVNPMTARLLQLAFPEFFRTIR